MTFVDREISIAANMASCAMDVVFLRFDLVLVAGVSFTSVGALGGLLIPGSFGVISPIGCSSSTL